MLEALGVTCFGRQINVKCSFCHDYVSFILSTFCSDMGSVFITPTCNLDSSNKELVLSLLLVAYVKEDLQL